MGRPPHPSVALPWSVATAASSIVLALVLAMWVRSEFVRDTLSFGPTSGNAHTATSILGRFHLITDLGGGRASGQTDHFTDRLGPAAIWNGGSSGYPAQPDWHLGCLWQRYYTYS